MKTQIGLYLEVSTAEELRAQAQAAGVSIGDLADLFLRKGLATVKPEALKAWAQARPSTRGPLGGGLRKDERAVLAAFDSLKASQAPAWRFSGAQLADTAGVRWAVGLWALKALQARGLVHGFELEAVDRWGRPVQSFWCLTGDRK